MIEHQHDRDRTGRTSTPIRVVIVDDSRTLRDWLRVILEQDPDLVVVGEAADALEARQIIRETNPDVITLDIEMPGMSGLDFLGKLMTLRPIPVVMISSATARGSEAAIRALSLGAVDCIRKPTCADSADRARNIARRVKSAAGSTPRALRAHRPPRIPALRRRWDDQHPIILIGASTGGVTALETVLSDLDPAGPPVVIVQHMPAAFLQSFTQMLDRSLPQDVRLLEDAAPIRPGQVRLAPTNGMHSGIDRVGGGWIGRHCAAIGNNLHCPSVDHLFTSAVPFSPQVICVILTGLGRDGAAGMLALRDAGAATFAQDEASCVVYGMPRIAWQTGAASKQVPLDAIVTTLNRAALRAARPAPGGRT